MSVASWNRKLHRWGALAAALPVLVILVTGLFLQLKKDVGWIQPPSLRGVGGEPTIALARVLEVTRGVAQMQVEDWGDIERLDVRPAHGILKVRGNNRWELQLDARTGAVLQVAYRRSDLIESLHDGSFFHERAKLWLFLPAGIVLLGLWVSGIYLWWLPHAVKRRRRRHAAS